jgi:hypothetical protein
VVILVDGMDIMEHLRKYEMPFTKKEGAENIAGGYNGISLETLWIVVAMHYFYLLKYPSNMKNTYYLTLLFLLGHCESVH